MENARLFPLFTIQRGGNNGQSLPQTFHAWLDASFSNYSRLFSLSLRREPPNVRTTLWVKTQWLPF